MRLVPREVLTTLVSNVCPGKRPDFRPRKDNDNDSEIKHENSSNPVFAVKV